MKRSRSFAAILAASSLGVSPDQRHRQAARGVGLELTAEVGHVEDGNGQLVERTDAIGRGLGHEVGARRRRQLGQLGHHQRALIFPDPLLVGAGRKKDQGPHQDEAR
jgi:hypothetical protein